MMKYNLKNDFVTSDINLRNKLIEFLYFNYLPYAYTETDSQGKCHVYADVDLASLAKTL